MRPQRASLRVYMLDLAVTIDGPACDRVEMFVRESGDCGNLGRLPAYGDKFGASRLHITRFVPRAALQHGGSAVPSPGHPESSECFAEHRFLQFCRSPAASAVRGD